MPRGLVVGAPTCVSFAPGYHPAVEEAVRQLAERNLIAFADLPAAVDALGIEPQGRLHEVLAQARDYVAKRQRERSRW